MAFVHYKYERNGSIFIDDENPNRFQYTSRVGEKNVDVNNDGSEFLPYLLNNTILRHGDSECEFATEHQTIRRLGQAIISRSRLFVQRETSPGNWANINTGGSPTRNIQHNYPREGRCTAYLDFVNIQGYAQGNRLQVGIEVGGDDRQIYGFRFRSRVDGTFRLEWVLDIPEDIDLSWITTKLSKQDATPIRIGGRIGNVSIRWSPAEAPYRSATVESDGQGGRVVHLFLGPYTVAAMEWLSIYPDTVTGSEAANGDDWEIWYESSVWNWSSDAGGNVYFGRYSAQHDWAGVRLALSGAIADNATIDTNVANTYLRYVANTTADSQSNYWYVTESADAGQVTGIAARPAIDGGSTTTYPTTAEGAGSVNNATWPTSGNKDIAVGSLIQHLVDQYNGLASGAHIVFWQHGAATEGDNDESRFVDYEHASLAPPSLAVTFTAGGPTTYTKTLSLNALIQKTITKTVSLNSYLQKSIPITLSVDTILQKVFSNSTLLDSLLNKTGVTKTTSIDSLLNKSGLTLNSDLDAFLSKIFTSQITIDTLLNKTGVTKTTSIDSLLNKLDLTVASSVDALLNKSGITSILSLDSYLYMIGSEDLIIDAILYKIKTQTVSIDAYKTLSNLTSEVLLDAILNKQYAKDLVLDAILQSENALDLTFDAFLYLISTKQISLDSILYKLLSINTEIDALLNKLNLTKSLEIDALLDKLNLTKSLEIDALLSKLNLTINSSIDSLLSKLGIQSLEIDALLSRLGLTINSSIDALLSKMGVQSLEIDALLSKLDLTKTLEIDALLSKLGIQSLEIDALLNKIDILKSLEIDGLLVKSGNLITLSIDTLLSKMGVQSSISIDSLLNKLDLTKNLSLDAILYSLTNPEIYMSLDALLNKVGVVFQVSLDSFLYNINNISSVLDGYLVKTVLNNLNIDALLIQSKQIVTSVDGYLLQVNTVNSLLDSYLTKINSLTTTLDAYLQGLGLAVEIDALLSSIGTKFLNLDVLLYAGRIKETSLDAIFYNNFTKYVNLNGILKKEYTKATFLDAIIYSALVESTAKYSFISELEKYSFVSTFAKYSFISELEKYSFVSTFAKYSFISELEKYSFVAWQ